VSRPGRRTACRRASRYSSSGHANLGCGRAQGFETKVLSDMTSDPETVFLLRRAEEEAILAIQADPAPAAAAHLELSLRYSARARTSLILGQGEIGRRSDKA
jgi:hypothetical protein